MKKLFIILFAAIFTMGCSDDNNEGGGAPEVQLSVSADALVFLASGDAPEGENALKITSTGKWRLSGKKTWCRPSAVEGESGQTVTFVADANPDSEPRTITYSFICGNKTSKVTVTQEPSSILDFATSTTFDVAVTGGQISLIVKATSDMTYKVAEKDKGWITPNATRAVETSFLSFTVASNPTFAPRTGDIIFTVDGKEVTVEVNQAQTNKVTVPVTDYAVDPAGETVTVNYTANVEITPDIADYPWITLLSNTASVAFSPGTMVFRVDEAKKSRSAQVKIKSTDGFTTYATLVMSQAAAAVTSVIPDAKFSAWLIAQGYVTTTAEPNKFELTSAGLAVSTFNIPAKGIESLEGIDAFETLMTLDCSDNQLTSLDLSKNSKLEKLNCEKNNIRVLNLKGCAPFASIGTSATSALRVSNNNLEEIYLSDDCTLRLTMAGKDKFTGKNGTKSTTLKIYAKGIVGLLCGLTGSLQTVDISECPACKEFKGGNETTGIKTVYITSVHEEFMNSSPSLWQKPSNAQYVVK